MKKILLENAVKKLNSYSMYWILKVFKLQKQRIENVIEVLEIEIFSKWFIMSTKVSWEKYEIRFCICRFFFFWYKNPVKKQKISRYKDTDKYLDSQGVEEQKYFNKRQIQMEYKEILIIHSVFGVSDHPLIRKWPPNFWKVEMTP